MRTKRTMGTRTISLHVLATCVLMVLSIVCANAQPGFNLQIVETQAWQQVPAVHSCAVAHWQGKWIFIGGRTNGLHGFEPPFAFPTSYVNNRIEVFDTLTKTVYTSSLDSLPNVLRRHLETNNMEYYQQGNTLYFMGGYGWNDSMQNFRTYPMLTTVDLPGLVQAVMNAQPIATYFRQLTDARLAVTGTWLEKIGSDYYLPFGHTFNGTYNVSDTTGTFTQVYTNAIRKFNIANNGTSLSIANYSETVDTNKFRRRDLNIVPQIFPDGTFGYTAFSGVFQKHLNKPYAFPIDITQNGYAVHDTFSQMFSHYHSAHLPVRSTHNNAMSTVFFGGMAMYRPDSTGAVVYDSLVPFVSTVSCITRDSVGGLHETYFSERFPALLGSNAIFMPEQHAPFDSSGILQLDSITGMRLVGYIIGGIESPLPNISQTGAEVSNASQRVFKVYITRTNTFAHFIIAEAPFDVKVFPNPASDVVTMNVQNHASNPNLVVQLYDMRMQLVHEKKFTINNGTSTQWKLKTNDLPNGTYYVKVSNGRFSRFVMAVVNR